MKEKDKERRTIELLKQLDKLFDEHDSEVQTALQKYEPVIIRLVLKEFRRIMS